MGNSFQRAYFILLLVGGFLTLSFQNCGGGHDLGQQGSSSNTSEPTPTPPEVTPPVFIFAGGVHTCLLQGGKLWCWGDNRWGMLGDGNIVNTSIPVNVTGMDGDVTHVATSWSHHICAIKSGVIHCWGQNTGGNLGAGSAAHRYAPAPVAGAPTGATAISGGTFQNCAIVSGGLTCWGSLHDGTAATVAAAATPQPFGGLTSGVQHVDVGLWHSCAVVNGGAKCWGNNQYGQLGNASNTASTVPVDVAGLGAGVSQIEVGEFFTCAIHNGVPKCWGRGNLGELGDGASVNQTTPVTVVGITDATQVAVTYNTGCALRATGGVKCWGFSAAGTRGSGEASGSVLNTPVDVTGMQTGATQLTGAGNHFCAVQNNIPKCWGSNFKGKIGDGTLTDRYVPTEVLRTRNPATALAATAAIINVTATTAGPISVFTPITWTVDAGPANTPLEYRYSIYNEDTSIWIYQPTKWVDQNFLTFNPDVAGNYHMQVWVRAKGKTVDYDDWRNAASFQAQ
ncbi:MAG: hypothetical protein ABL958_00520 [Bdellovibrionia bacterium]